MARSPYEFGCPACGVKVGEYCRALKAEIVGAINVGDVLKGSVHSGRYLLAINPSLNKLQEMPIGDVR